MLPRSLVNTSVQPSPGWPFWASAGKPSRNSRGSSILRARMPCEATTQSRKPRLCRSVTGERRYQGQLVADPDALDRVEVLGHDDVGLAARVERDEQQAPRGQPLLAQVLEPEDDRRRLPVVVDAGREHGGLAAPAAPLQRL